MRQRDDWHLTADIDHEAGQGDPFAAAIRGTRMPMCITDPRQSDNPIVFVNEAFQKLTGYDRDETIGRNCRFLQGPATNSDSTRKIHDALTAEQAINIDVLNYRKDGTTFWNALYISPVRGDDGKVQFFFASQLDVTERIEVQRMIAEQKARVEEEVRARTADLQAALEAKTLLLHEVDHRVKNNLTMIGSLLRLQARTTPDPDFRRTLDTMLERIDALAAVHRRLYQSEDIAQFELSEFVASLTQDVIGSTGRQDIEIVLDLQPVTITSRDATAVGMIVNELLINAVKHAFDGRGGTLRVDVAQRGGDIAIGIADDGAGFDVAKKRSDTIGRTLIDRLVRQVGGRVEWASDGSGTRATVSVAAR